MGDDEFMAAVKELTTTAMAYGVSLATDDGGSQLRAALMKADPRAPIGESLAPFVDSLLRPTTTVVILAPGKWVTTNGQRARHHYDQAATVTPWRQAAALAARGMEPIAPPVTITATIHKSHNRRYDLDGITPTVKACIDGLRDAGGLADDDDRHVVALTVRAGCVCKPARVELRVEAS